MTLSDTALSPTEALTEALLDRLKADAADAVQQRRSTLIDLSHTIHDEPELSWQEHKAAAAVAAVLQSAGFATEVGAYGVETAIEATFGTGDLTVAICAEYDALPGVGHACGHNMIAAAGVGAALSLATLADQAGLRIKLLGTPAEEHGGGKVPLLTAGAWEDATFSLMVHGGTGQDVGGGAFQSTAVERFEVEFTGFTAHAAGAPEKGINAGAAATLALSGLGLLRQQLPSGTNVNAFISLGGEATNIIPDKTLVQVEVRAYDIEQWRESKRRVLACFEGAAIATGCTWSYHQTEHPYAPMNNDALLTGLWDDNMAAIGRTADTTRVMGGGSTDMGNVSQVLPAIHGMISVLGSDAVPHNPEFAAAAATPAADDAVIDGATLIAWTVLDVALTAGIRDELLNRQLERPAGATRVTLQS